MLESLPDFQIIHKSWRLSITPLHEFTPQVEHERVQEEYQELAEAIRDHQERPTPHTAREVGMEAVDVIIGMLGIISALNLDAATLMEKKLETIYDKYNPIQNKRLQRQHGLTWKEAMLAQKQLYQRRDLRTPLAAN